MIVEFDKSFYRYLSKIKDRSIHSKIIAWIIKFEGAASLNEISEADKLTGFKSYYKIRIGDYRLGFSKLGPNKIRLIIIAHRKDIYKLFP